MRVSCQRQSETRWGDRVSERTSEPSGAAMGAAMASEAAKSKMAAEIFMTCEASKEWQEGEKVMRREARCTSALSFVKNVV